ncbi:MAG: hypothetical protein ABR532_06430 [Candidatus Dormibacteria bacterium]
MSEEVQEFTAEALVTLVAEYRRHQGLADDIPLTLIAPALSLVRLTHEDVKPLHVTVCPQLGSVYLYATDSLVQTDSGTINLGPPRGWRERLDFYLLHQRVRWRRIYGWVRWGWR